MDEPLTIPQLFLATVERLGPRVALRKKELGLWQDITWNEYAQTVSRVTLGLISLGLQKGDHAAIIGPRHLRPAGVARSLGCPRRATTGSR